MATRKLLKCISTQFPDTPVLGLMDNDPYGLEILSIYKFGSKVSLCVSAYWLNWNSF